MACPNFKNGPKTGLRPLGIKFDYYNKKGYYFILLKALVDPYGKFKLANLRV
jgi:hypothetical protein